MPVTAILLAAGKGERFGSRIPKPMVRLQGRPILDYSLKVLDGHPRVARIILAVSPANRKSVQALVKKGRYGKVVKIVLGGPRRQDSVFNALKEAGPEKLVLIHDSARPFVEAKQISALIARAAHTAAAILGVPVKATVKEVSPGLVVKRTLDRSGLWEIQTPQVFRKDLLVAAYGKFGRSDVTDDAALLEKYGRKVSLVRGSYSNIKITTPEDLYVAQALLKAKKR